ncbi:MAG: OmpA family protein [Proteobacteria bacterium]|nr:OmpA family protein [Pseudomonadota bacterium]MDA1352184.1 OmpA family protein [Pseudomonadota bacterium]
MNISVTKTGLSALCLSLVLAGCSSTPVDETMSNIEDTTVQTVALEMETETTAIEEAPVEPTMSAATVFYFDFDKTLLKSESRAALVEHAAFLMDNTRSVRLEGHADERGTREYNMALGESRGNAVKEFLVLQGVSPSMIEVISYGEEQAASFGSSNAAWSMNRRVELK